MGCLVSRGEAGWVYLEEKCTGNPYTTGADPVKYRRSHAALVVATWHCKVQSLLEGLVMLSSKALV